jgi:acyl carrier protein
VIAAFSFEALARLVRETQARPESDPIRPDQLLFHDLGFTSMDLLDLIFRIEDGFGVTIAEGTLHRLARGELAEDEFARDGLLTPLGRERLMALLSDTPPELFPPRVPASNLPGYCTVAAMGRLVQHLLGEKQRAACSS